MSALQPVATKMLKAAQFIARANSENWSTWSRATIVLQSGGAREYTCARNLSDAGGLFPPCQMRKSNKGPSMPASNVRTNVRRCLCIIGATFAMTAINPVFASDKPLLSPDQDTPLIVQSKVSAVLSFSARTLADELNREVPQRLASFTDRATTCGERRGFFRRQVPIQCVVTGYIERTSPVYLSAQGNRVEAEVKLDGSVYAQGARGLARLVHGVAQGAMNVFVDANPRLNRDWSVSLNISQSYRWTEPPMLRVFGRDIPIARYVEPQIQAQSRRVEGEVAAKMRAIDVRAKAEAAWRRAFTPVQIADSTWLRMTPQSVAFAGLHSTSDVLEGAIEFSGPVETDFGATAPTASPTPLPPLGSDVSDPGHFEFLLPLTLELSSPAGSHPTSCFPSVQRARQRCRCISLQWQTGHRPAV